MSEADGCGVGEGVQSFLVDIESDGIKYPTIPLLMLDATASAELSRLISQDHKLSILGESTEGVYIIPATCRCVWLPGMSGLPTYTRILTTTSPPLFS